MWAFSGVYGPDLDQDKKKKKKFMGRVSRNLQLVGIPWCIVGNFNRCDS